MKRPLWLPCLLILVLMALSSGCPGTVDAPPTLDGVGGQEDLWWPQVDAPPQQQDTGPQQQDTGSPWPDGPTTADAYQWPDTYSGAPFGCQNNSDCFGLRCCPTPWGVKLCAAVCE